VAVLLVAARRRRRDNASEVQARAPAAGPQGSTEKPSTADPCVGAHAPQPKPVDAERAERVAPSEPRPTSAVPNAVARASESGSKRSHPALAASRFVCKVAPYSVELPLPGMHRAALAITLGKPAELRRLAHDLQRAGQDTEAGLLGNYALLLERSSVSRERILAEVTRMLRAAAAERRSARRDSPAIPWPPTAPWHDSVSAAREGPAVDDAAPAPRHVAGAQASSVVPLPMLALGAGRRAAR
jgi:hypothetical protein